MTPKCLYVIIILTLILSIYATSEEEPQAFQCYGTECKQIYKSLSSTEKRSTPTLIVDSRTISWEVLFTDCVNGTGIGFDSPTNGDQAQAIVVEVLQYLGGILDFPNRNKAKRTLSVTFEASENVQNGSRLASAGTFWVGFRNSFNRGAATLRYERNVKPFPQFSNPDISVTVNFGAEYHFSMGTNITNSTYDFYTVLLHEIIHGFGFTSLTLADGSSSTGVCGKEQKKNKLTNFRTRFERSMYLQNFTTLLFSSVGSLRTPTSGLTGAAGPIVYKSHETEACDTLPQLYFPSTFRRGSSMSHIDATAMPQAVMNHGLYHGQLKRELQPAEISILESLGWVFNNTLAPSCYSLSLPPTRFLTNPPQTIATNSPTQTAIAPVAQLEPSTGSTPPPTPSTGFTSPSTSPTPSTPVSGEKFHRGAAQAKYYLLAIWIFISLLAC